MTGGSKSCSLSQCIMKSPERGGVKCKLKLWWWSQRVSPHTHNAENPVASQQLYAEREILEAPSLPHSLSGLDSSNSFTSNPEKALNPLQKHREGDLPTESAVIGRDKLGSWASTSASRPHKRPPEHDPGTEAFVTGPPRGHSQPPSTSPDPDSHLDWVQEPGWRSAQSRTARLLYQSPARASPKARLASLIFVTATSRVASFWFVCLCCCCCEGRSGVSSLVGFFAVRFRSVSPPPVVV